MASLTSITDYADRVVARLIEKLKRSVSIRGVLTAFAAQAQEIEDALAGLLVTRDPNLAEGTTLDNIGSIVGAPREGLDDAAYLLRIKAQILINRRSGEIETLITICTLLFAGATARLVEFDDDPGALVHLYVESITTDYPTAARVAALLRAAKAAGVQFRLIWQPAEDADTFTLAGGGGLGLGDSANPATGGQMVGSA